MASISTVPEEPDSSEAAVPTTESDVPSAQRNMNKEEDRLMTFVRWPNTSPVSAERLARAGFFYSGAGDRVTCFACDNALDDWNFGDDVMKRHRKTFPNCDFVRSVSKNVPYYKSGLESRLHLQLLESMDSGFDRSVSRPATPCSSIYQSGSRDDIHRTRYNTADSAYRSLHRRSSVFSGSTNNDVPDAVFEGLDMRVDENRRASFAKWPISFISPLDLSASGFFFTGHQDRVRCAFCGGILGMWQLGDNPFTEHQKHFPWCTFTKKGYSSEYSSAQSSPTSNGHGNDVCGSFTAANSLPPRFPCSPYLNDYQARLSTFRNWPPNRIQTPEHLAYAGFFYTGVNDNVRCFFCDGGLRCWDPQDEAWQEHAKWFPKCPYLLETKGADFVEKLQASMGENVPGPSRVESIPTTPVTDEESIVKRTLEMGFAQPSVEQALRDRHTSNRSTQLHSVEELINGVLEVENKNRRPEATKLPRPVSGLFAKLRSLSRDADKDVSVEKLTEENRILKQQRRCKICLDREVSTVFLPCGHLISCSECAPSLRTCSLCRRGIRGTVKTFLS